jgi:transposase
MAGKLRIKLIEACDETIPFEVCEALAPLVVQLRNLDDAIAQLDRIIAKLAQKDETARRLMSIPGFGPITASAMAATIRIHLAGVVTLSKRRREAGLLCGTSSGRDDLAPRGHRRGAKHAVRLS